MPNRHKCPSPDGHFSISLKKKNLAPVVVIPRWIGNKVRWRARPGNDPTKWFSPFLGKTKQNETLTPH